MTELKNGNFICRTNDNKNAQFAYKIGNYEISLKSVVEHKHLSDETIAFDGTLYINGKKAGLAYNRGCGGPNEVGYEERINGFEFEQNIKKAGKDIDSIISNLVAVVLDFKTNKKRGITVARFFKGYNELGGFWA